MATTTSSITAPTFQASGLASGLDSASIINSILAVEQQPVTLLQSQQTGFKAQVSTLGVLSSKLTDLQTAMNALATSGATATKVTSNTVGFDAVTGSGALAGRHTVQVTGIASAAVDRSQGFDSATAPVTGGTLRLTVQGQSYPPADQPAITIGDGSSLADVAFAISQSGAPVSATVVSDGTKSYLSIIANDTGYPIGGAPSDALSIEETSTGTQGQPLNIAEVQAAGNATLTVDKLPITRTNNSVSDVIPGVTLNLKAQTTSDETLVIGNDIDNTAANLQKVVDAYNGVMSIIQSQLNVSSTDDRSQTLAGDSTLRNLQGSVQKLLSTVVGSSSVRSLADIGIQSDKDGVLSLDTPTLQKAMSRDPNAINDLFSHQGTGMAAVTSTLVDQYTNVVDGLLNIRSKSLTNSISNIDDEIAQMNARIQTHHDQLVAQFTAMEQIVSSLKDTGNFLTQQAASKSSSSS